MIQIVLPRATWLKFTEPLREAVPDAVWLTLDDREVRAGGGAGVAESFNPEVAWLTHDAIRQGAVETFFDYCDTSTNLKLLQSATASADGPRFTTLLERGVRVATSHVTGISISEYVLGAVLRHYQQPRRWDVDRNDRIWRQHDFRELYGTTWLIVGLGTIGGTLARMLRACGVKTIGVRRNPTGHEPVAEVITPDRLATFIPVSDVVVLCAPPSEENFHLINATVLSRMKQGSVLVNVARGSLVDEDALLAALDTGAPEAAIIDVFSQEPLPFSDPLWVHPRVIMTPHNSGWGSGRYERALDVFLHNLTCYRAGEPLRYEINRTFQH